MTKIAKNTICLWYERDAEEAARFQAETDRYWRAIVDNGGRESEARREHRVGVVSLGVDCFRIAHSLAGRG